MGKGIPTRVTAANRRMPFKARAVERPSPRTWKQRQRSWVTRGLKRMRAPLAGNVSFPNAFIYLEKSQAFHALPFLFGVPGQVALTLASLVFNIQGLSWDSPQDHWEGFAGHCSITRGEWEVGLSFSKFQGLGDSGAPKLER